MRVTLHYKHTNHSWLRYCSKEIIGLKLVWLLKHFSVPFAEIENLRTDYILREKKKRLQTLSTARLSSCLYPPVTVCVCACVYKCVWCSESTRSVKTGRCCVVCLVLPSLSPVPLLAHGLRLAWRSAHANQVAEISKASGHSCIKWPGWEIRPLQCRFDSSECQQPSASSGLYLNLCEVMHHVTD